ncbi:zinc-dependent alcohol dehydrogenase family protein [Geminicoccus roseus]|uniref:zinc-dependent alcohol dehydrogenase family protein n=1 Tax=Geminicoccus roseus TaxID=404900 RepID=UPI000406369C|nr:NAD(P)-dependent alcohol dehydrogenase [Geminicoccus roseus]
MRAYEIVAGSGVDSIALRERPEPVAGPGEVVIEVKACSLNYRDTLVIGGTYAGAGKKTGQVPLSDGAGTVASVGAGVTRLAVGDRVAGAFMPGWVDGPLTAEKQKGSLGGDVDGMLAERVVLPATGVVRVPEHLSFAEAATLPCAGVTAWYAQFVGGQLRPGQTVLLLGTGGVSIFALQFAKLAGARVIITSSDEAKLERARQLGADHLINYRASPDWQHEVLALTDGTGADHAVEVGGPGTLNRTLEAVRFGGSISLMGTLTGLTDSVATSLILMKNIRVQGTYVGSVAMFEDMNRAIALHRSRPVIDRRFGFDEAAMALRHLGSGQHFGKVVIEA